MKKIIAIMLTVCMAFLVIPANFFVSASMETVESFDACASRITVGENYAVINNNRTEGSGSFCIAVTNAAENFRRAGASGVFFYDYATPKNLTGYNYFSIDVFTNVALTGSNGIHLSFITDKTKSEGFNILLGVDNLSMGWHTIQFALPSAGTYAGDTLASISAIRIMYLNYAQNLQNVNLLFDNLAGYTQSGYAPASDTTGGKMMLCDFDSADFIRGAFGTNYVVIPHIKTQGNGALHVVPTDFTSNIYAAMIYVSLKDPVDLVLYNNFHMDVYVNEDINSNDSKFQINFCSSNSDDGFDPQISIGSFKKGWNSIDIPLNTIFNNRASNEIFAELSRITSIRIGWFNNSKTTYKDQFFVFDNMCMTEAPPLNCQTPSVISSDTTLESFDSLNNIYSVCGRAKIDSSDKKEGSGCVSLNGSGYLYINRSGTGFNIAIPNRSEYYFDFWLYISNLSAIQSGSVVEFIQNSALTSRLDLFRLELTNGWNHLTLPLTNMTAEMASVNGFRVAVNTNSVITVKVDGLRLIKSPCPDRLKPTLDSQFTLSGDYAFAVPTLSAVSAQSYKSQFADNNYVKFFNTSDVEISSAAVGTGCKIKLADGNRILKTQTVVKYYDTNGDGLTSSVDALNVLQASVDMISLNTLQTLAAKKGSSGNVSATDALKILRYSLGIYNYNIETGLINPVYETSDTVFADYNVLSFGADPTGVNDSTSAIQKALDTCFDNGGGTVWMPVGKYLVTNTIAVRIGCTLRGDWQDPDKGSDYGTIIIARPQPGDNPNTGLFAIQWSCGVVGVTVYYPEQNIKNPTPYSSTFYTGGWGMAKTIKNCTLINSYRGISSHEENTHEMMMIENVKGTCIKSGVAVLNSSDVGTIDGLTLTPDYWVKAGSGKSAVNFYDVALYNQLAKNSGLVITDAEQQQYNNITVKGFYSGILFPVNKGRYQGAGSFFNLDISSCVLGIYAESGLGPNSGCPTIDSRWGYNIAKSSIKAQIAINNSATPVDGQSGTVKLCGVSVKGHLQGNIITTSINTDLSAYSANTQRTAKTTGKALKKLPAGSDVTAVQNALNEVGNVGGGVVYLAPGRYYFSKGLHVPANVELRGAASVEQRVGDKGTAVFIQQGKCADEDTALNAEAAVTLDGKNAGVSGIFFIYPEQIAQLNAGPTFSYFPFTVRGKAENVFCTNCCIAGSSHGIDFTRCNNHVIKNLVACCMCTTMFVGGSNGLIANCLQNATVLCRTNLDDCILNDGYLFSHVFDPITRKKTRYIYTVNASGEQIANCFIYGGCNCIYSLNSTMTAVNVGGDNVGDPGTGVLLVGYGGKNVIINSLRFNGDSYHSTENGLVLYNRMSIGDQNEIDIIP